MALQEKGINYWNKERSMFHVDGGWSCPDPIGWSFLFDWIVSGLETSLLRLIDYNKSQQELLWVNFSKKDSIENTGNVGFSTDFSPSSPFLWGLLKSSAQSWSLGSAMWMDSIGIGDGENFGSPRKLRRSSRSFLRSFARRFWNQTWIRASDRWIRPASSSLRKTSG